MEIGDKVIWKVGKVESKGVFIENKEDETSTVITHFIGGMIANREIVVDTRLLNKVNW